MLISLLGMVMILIFGFFFGNFFSNVELASGLLSFMMVPFLMLSGALMPIEIFPESFQSISYILPFTYLTDLYHSTLFGTEGLIGNFWNVGIIVMVSVAFFYFTIKTFKWI